jgi:hypothetical protein
MEHYNTVACTDFYTFHLVLCYKVMGLSYEDIAKVLNMDSARVWAFYRLSTIHIYAAGDGYGTRHIKVERALYAKC